MSALRKFVLITGCSSGGIGESLAQVFQEKGYHVFATVRNPNKISQALASTNNVNILALDVSSSDSIDAAVDHVKKITGSKLDVLINNSGGTLILPALDTSIEEAKKVFDVNFWGSMAMFQAFAPLLINAKGCLVNNTSANAYVPMPLMGVYNASKAALASSSETWRQELKPLGVRTITLITTGVKTESFDRYQPVEVPESSLYYGIRGFIHDVSDGRLQKNAISPRQYATKVVREVEKGTTGIVWAGTDALFARLGTWMSPQYILDMLIENLVPFGSSMAQAAQKKKD